MQASPISPVPSGPAPADLALVIVPTAPASGEFLYRTVDRRTGEVVLELPDPKVLRARQGAGRIVDTTV